MANNSVIRLSGQLWKLVVALLALLVGSFAPLYEPSGISWTAGSIIAIAGYAFGIISIQCSHCGVRWFWQAATDGSVYGRLFKQSSCPKCGYNFKTD